MKPITMAICVCVLFAKTANAQFGNMFGPSRSWGFTDNANRLGVGNFPTGHPFNPNLPATLTVDGRTVRLLPPLMGTPANQTGRVFETYSPANELTTWRMHRGNTEVGRIFNNANDIHFRFQATQANSSIMLHNSVGIGAFANNAVLPAVLSVDATLLTNPSNTAFQTNGVDLQPTFWRMFRGNSEKVRMYNLSTDNDFNILLPQNQSSFIFRTPSPSPFTPVPEAQRMVITQRRLGVAVLPGQFDDVARVTISESGTAPITQPASLLHLGFNAEGNYGGGWRSWMDVGTFTGTTTDNMYVGMKSESNNINGPLNWADAQSAVISWGNNPLIGPRTDRLRFIFTAATTSTDLLASGQEGLEIARMVTDGNIPKMGIGDFPISAATQGQDPDNVLEIRSNVPTNTLAATNPTDVITRSGLRFTNLTSTMPIDITSNSSGTVLSVNEKGDLILVEDRGDSGAPNCNNLLATDAGYGLNGHNFYFTGLDPNADKVSIGVGCLFPLAAKLQVRNVVAPGNALSRVAGFFTNAGSEPNTFFVHGVRGVSRVTGFRVINVGGEFEGGLTSPYNTTSPRIAYGVVGRAVNADRNEGGRFFAIGGVTNIGVFASVATVSGGQPLDVAGWFNGDIVHTGSITPFSDRDLKENFSRITNSLTTLSRIRNYQFNFKTIPYLALPDGLQYGVVAQEIENILPELVSDVTVPEELDTMGNVINPAQTYKAVNYMGLIPITMQAVQDLNLIVSNATLSDQQLKQNIQPLQNSLSLINQLEGVSYNWNQQADTTLSLPLGTEIGLIAQDVESVIPEVIFTDDKGYKHIEYQKLIPHLIEANKQLRDSLLQIAALSQQVAAAQNSQIAALSQQVATLQNCMNNLPIGMNCNGANASVVIPSTQMEKEPQKIVLESSNMAILYQNQPNPFENNTIIRYYVPEQTREAKIVFHDEFGREINNVVLASKGYAQIEISSENLVSGVYTYSLVVDGKFSTLKRCLKSSS